MRRSPKGPKSTTRRFAARRLRRWRGGRLAKRRVFRKRVFPRRRWGRVGSGVGVAGTVREYAGDGGTVQASLRAISRRVPCSRGRSVQQVFCQEMSPAPYRVPVGFEHFFGGSRIRHSLYATTLMTHSDSGAPRDAYLLPMSPVIICRLTAIALLPPAMDGRATRLSCGCSRCTQSALS